MFGSVQFLFSAEEKEEEEPTAQDPYFKIANWTNEHEDFKKAETRMDEKHRKKVEKVRLFQNLIIFFRRLQKNMCSRIIVDKHFHINL